MFNIDFRALIQLLLPVGWRKPKHIVWLSLILSAIKGIYNEFLAFRTSKLYDINFTGQVIYIEKKLNDLFATTGIYIADVTFYPKLYLNNKIEDFLPIYFGNKWNTGEVCISGDWIIYNNFWFNYIGTGNGDIPSGDPVAIIGHEIETYINDKYDASNTSDFTVNVPIAVYNNFTEDDILKLKKIIEYYKLAEMRYTIKTY
jgi:hypothetical protein